MQNFQKHIIENSTFGGDHLAGGLPENFDFGGGWGSEGTDLFMPLSPTHMMYTQIGRKPGFEHGDVLPLEIAAKFQRFTIESAYRYIFARSADRQVELWRPRTVDSQAFHAEAAQWKSWDASQSEAERDFFESLA